MGKLHELLAVSGQLKGQAEKILSETTGVFSKKQSLFEGHTRRYTPRDDEGEQLPPEDKLMTTTVPEKIDYTADFLEKYLDAVFQKDMTNTVAKADLVLPGPTDAETVVIKDLPPTFLLTLESWLTKVRSMLAAAPTTDLGEAWAWSPDKECWVADPKQTIRTKKVRKNHVKAPATDKHPAQVEVYTEDVPVGTWSTTRVSGALSPLQKHQLMERVDTALLEVKKARERANCHEATTAKIAKGIMDYILAPVFPQR